MANISLDHPNYAYVDNYFFTMDNSVQMLLKITFDGSMAFCYTLDVPLSYEVQALSYDGLNFWSLEYGDNKVIVKRWRLINAVCEQRDKFEFVSTVSETLDSKALAIEAYETSFSGDEPSGQTILSIANGSHMSAGDKLYLGPNQYGDTEYVTVHSATSTSVTLTSATVHGYQSGNKIRFYKYGYFFNNANGTDTSTGSLYKFDLYTGSVVRKDAGTQYKDIRAADIVTVADRSNNPVLDYDDDGSLDVFDALVFVKNSLLFIMDLYSSSFRVISTMLLDIDVNETIYDLTTQGSVLYLLESGYDYKVAQFDIVVMSVSLSAYPAIIPANGVSTSLVTATVLDQYNNPIENKLVKFTASTGSLSAASDMTDANGVASVTFTSSTTVGTSTITATVDQN